MSIDQRHKAVQRELKSQPHRHAARNGTIDKAQEGF